MKAFAELYAELDATTSSNAKLAAMQAYFAQAAPEDAAWAVYFLSGGRPRQLVPVRILRELAVAVSGLEPWLFEESYQAVGDLAETISLVLPENSHSSEAGLAEWIEDKLLPLRRETPEYLMRQLPMLWAQLDRASLMLCIKLITGSFRVGVSKLQVTQALAVVAGVDPKRVAQRLMGYTHIGAQPTAADYAALPEHAKQELLIRELRSRRPLWPAGEALPDTLETAVGPIREVRDAGRRAAPDSRGWRTGSAAARPAAAPSGESRLDGRTAPPDHSRRRPGP